MTGSTPAGAAYEHSAAPGDANRERRLGGPGLSSRRSWRRLLRRWPDRGVVATGRRTARCKDDAVGERSADLRVRAVDATGIVIEPARRGPPRRRRWPTALLGLPATDAQGERVTA